MRGQEVEANRAPATQPQQRQGSGRVRRRVRPAPSSASLRAAALPMPDMAPLTSAVLPAVGCSGNPAGLGQQPAGARDDDHLAIADDGRLVGPVADP